MNQWLAGQMIEPDELQDHITELPAELVTRDVEGGCELEVLRFKTDLPEIKEAAELMDERLEYNVEKEAEGVIISIRRVYLGRMS